MKRFNRVLLNTGLLVLMPGIAGAAGTYYDGNLYQNPQRQYQTNRANVYSSYGMGRGYNQGMQTMGMRKTTVQTQTRKQTKQEKKSAENKKQGFVLGAGLSHEFANWDFSMNQAGSNLSYDGVVWNVISGNAAYYFGNSVPMQIKVGAKYGKQYNEILMLDDDISSEKMWETQDVNGQTFVVGVPALSVGTGKDGSQMGFNAAFGLTDLFKWCNVKFTPSVGYRYLKYELQTQNNYGLAVQVVHSDTVINCIEVQPGEIQCSPYVGFADSQGNVQGIAGFAVDSSGNILVNPDGSYVILNTTSPQLDFGNTYYYEQDGTSHKYETEWAGPYLGLDMEYAINDNNLINVGIEFGLPMYTSKGDQPYRFDWAHPTSVEDTGDFGDAWHFGLTSDWSTRLTDSISLSLGFTYDYYKVSDATVKTYLNAAYYQSIYDEYKYYHDAGQLTDEGEKEFAELTDLRAKGWTIESANEIESIYKSMGIRLGLSAKF